MKFGYNPPSGFREKSFETVDRQGRMNDIRQSLPIL